MRNRILIFLKFHPLILNFFWKCARIALQIWGLFIPIKKNILFVSFGGRKFDDSPRAIYENICNREEFDDWNLIWAFVNPDEYEVPRGRKVKIDTLEFFYTLLSSKVWISNSGMTRGISLKRKNIVRVETWHGTPLKKIGGDENQNAIGGKKEKKGKLDTTTIRCAQSEFDRDIFSRIFNTDKSMFLLCDLPRNDVLSKYNSSFAQEIRNKLGIMDNKKVILYTPTYREYLINENKDTYLLLPIDFNKWKKLLGEEYVLLIRAHYAVSRALDLVDDEFVKDVSNYPQLNDLYIIADLMISDYSSTFIDYSILCRPMACYAYDLEEYREKRGFYLDLEKTLPCPISKTEDEVLEHIINLNYQEASEAAKKFHMKFTPHAGDATNTVVNEIENRLGMR